jgi:hypothetical protein
MGYIIHLYIRHFLAAILHLLILILKQLNHKEVKVK